MSVIRKKVAVAIDIEHTIEHVSPSIRIQSFFNKELKVNFGTTILSIICLAYLELSLKIFLYQL